MNGFAIRLLLSPEVDKLRDEMAKKVPNVDTSTPLQLRDAVELEELAQSVA